VNRLAAHRGSIALGSLSLGCSRQSPAGDITLRDSQGELWPKPRSSGDKSLVGLSSIGSNLGHSK